MLKKCLTTASLFLVFNSAHAGYNVFANGIVYTNNFAPPTAIVGYDAGQKSLASIDLFTDASYDDLAGHTGYAYSALKIKSEPGRLHLFADAFATNNLYPGFDGGVAGFRFDDRDSKPRALAGFSDSLIPTSTVLPLGTPVDFAVRITLEGTRVATLESQPVTTVHLRSSFYGNSYSSLLVMPLGTNVVTDDFIVHGQIGYEMSFGSYIEAQGYTSSVSGSNPSFLTIDAWNTGSMTFAPVDPNVSFTTSSGYGYQAVPEPGSFAALSLGALALLRRRKQRRSL